MALADSSKKQAPLYFEDSSHSMVGMDGLTVDTLRDNAPRVVGGLRLSSILMAAAAHPLLGMHALFVLGSESVLLLFGNRQQVEKHKAENNDTQTPNPLSKAVQPHKYPLESSAALDVIGEIPHFLLGAGILMGVDMPWVESFLGEEAAAQAAEALGECPPGHESHCIDGVHTPHTELPSAPERPNFAERPQTLSFQDSLEAARARAEELAAGGAAPTAPEAVTDTTPEASPDAISHVHLTGGALMLHGALGVMAHLPLWLFGPEKAGHHAGHLDFVGDDIAPSHVQESLEFAESKSKIVGTEDKGLMQWFRDNQVAISSVLQVAIGVTMMVAVGMPDMYRLAGIPLIAAGALQAAFVTKSDFSVDGPLEEVTEKQVSSASHYGTLMKEYEKLTGAAIVK